MGVLAIHLYDAVFLAVVLVIAISGAVRGLSRELGEAVMTVALGWGLIHYLKPAGDALAAHTGLARGAAAGLAAFLMTAAVVLLWLLLWLVLRKVAHFNFKGSLERGGGAVLGALKGVVAGAFFVVVAVCVAPGSEFAESLTRESWFARHVVRVAPALYERVAARYELPALPRPVAEGLERPAARTAEDAPQPEADPAKAPHRPRRSDAAP